MKKIILGILILFFGACSQPKIDNKSTKMLKDGIYFSNLEHADIGYDLSPKVPKMFSVDDNISFTINTNEKSWYLYIFYIDSDGQLSLLYPNSQSPLTKIYGIVTTHPI